MANITGFFKSIVAPALISLAIYLVLQYAVLPLYRRHRARYSQYLPLSGPTYTPYTTPYSSSTNSSGSLLHSLSHLTSSATGIISLLLPSRWAERAWQRRQSPQHRGRVVNASSTSGQGTRQGVEIDLDDDDEELGEDLDFELPDSLDEERESSRRRRDGLSLSFDTAARVNTTNTTNHDRIGGGGGGGGDRVYRASSRQRGASSDRRLSRELEEGFADSSDEEEEEEEERFAAGHTQRNATR